MTVVKTIGVGSLAITPDYTSINGWDSYLNGLGTFTEDQTGRLCWAGSGNELITSGETLDGSTPSTFAILLEAGDTNGNAGGSFRDNANKTTNALRYNASNGACVLCNSGTTQALSIADPNITVQYLQFKKTSNSGVVLEANSADTGKIVDSCILQGSPSGAFTRVFWGRNTVTKNCLILLSNTTSTAAEGFKLGSNNGDFLNNTVVCTVGASSRIGYNKYGSGTVLFRNNAFYGWGTDWSGSASGVTASHNATDLSSGASGLPGTDRQYDLIGADEWESVTQGAEDFRLKSGSAKCKDLGTSTGAPTTDIIDQTRS